MSDDQTRTPQNDNELDERRPYRKPKLSSSDAFEKLVLASCAVPDDSLGEGCEVAPT